MNAKQLFNETLPAALTANADKLRSHGVKYQFNILGAGEWHMDLTPTGPTVCPGSKKADVTLSISDDDFGNLVKNPGSAMGMFFSGKLKVTGNQMLATRLKDVFNLLQ